MRIYICDRCGNPSEDPQEWEISEISDFCPSCKGINRQSIRDTAAKFIAELNALKMKNPDKRRR